MASEKGNFGYNPIEQLAGGVCTELAFASKCWIETATVTIGRGQLTPAGVILSASMPVNERDRNLLALLGGVIDIVEYETEQLYGSLRDPSKPRPKQGFVPHTFTIMPTIVGRTPRGLSDKPDLELTIGYEPQLQTTRLHERDVPLLRLMFGVG